MLDALAQSERLPVGAGRLEGIERLAVGEVPDGVDADRKARPRGSADVVFQLFLARDLDAGPVEQAGRLGAERAVHEGLQVAELQQRAAEAAAHVHAGELVCLLGRQRLPDAQPERALGGEALPEAQRAEPAVLVVDRGHAAGGRQLYSRAHRLDVLVVGRLDVAVAEVPAGLLAQHAGRLAALVELDDAAGHLQIAVGQSEPGRVEPDGVRVAGHQRHRPVRGDRVQRVFRRLDERRPVSAPPAPAAQPGRPGRALERAAHARERLVQRARVLEPDLVLGQRPGGEVHVRVREAGQHAPPAEVDSLGSR